MYRWKILNFVTNRITCKIISCFYLMDYSIHIDKITYSICSSSTHMYENNPT